MKSSGMLSCFLWCIVTDVQKNRIDFMVLLLLLLLLLLLHLLRLQGSVDENFEISLDVRPLRRD